MKNIVVVAPYAQLRDRSEKIIQKKSFDDVCVIEGDLREGVQIAAEAVQNGARVLVSRGGTYRLLRDAFSVPVVEIRTTFYDVLVNLRHVLKKNLPLAIVGDTNIIYGYDIVQEFAPHVQKYDINCGKPTEQIIRECADKGITLFAGGAGVTSLCRKMGLTCYLLESGENSIVTAIEEARRVLGAAKKEIEQALRYKTLIDFVHDAVIATDSQNKVLLCNMLAQDILGVRAEDIIGKPIGSIPCTGNLFAGIAEGAQLIDELRQCNEMRVAVSNVPITVNGEHRGAVAVFQDVTRLQNLENKIRLQLAAKGFVARHTFESIIHRSGEMDHCISVAKKFSAYDSCVLIEGGSGVGKELFAQSIHNKSHRRECPFVAVNCAALPGSLIESELFGYTEGAFTGSKKGGRAGVFETAHKGTLFLDEIGEIPLEYQGRLLRVIQEREVMRLGDSRVIPLDVRLICATNRNLREMALAGTFRRDLLYRINALSLYIPPLDQRRDDIPVIAEHFLRRFSIRYGKNIEGFSPAALAYLSGFTFEGNVRELQGMIERAVIVCESPLILPDDLHAGSCGASRETDQVFGQDAVIPQNLITATPSLAELEKQYIAFVYAQTENSAAKTCEILKINRTTLWRKLKKTPSIE